MIEQVDIKCNCCEHHFVFPEDGPQGSIMALRGYWKNKLNDQVALLSVSPDKNSTHLLSLNPPIKFKLKDVLWIYYENAYAHLEGIESLEDIKSIRFCECRIDTILDFSESGVTIEVFVLKSLSLDDIQKLEKNFTFPLNDFIHDILINSVESNTIERFENYTLLSVNMQSDLGAKLIIDAGPKMSTILCINDWGFHRDFIFAGNFIVENKKLEKYGL